MREILFRGKHAISGEWIYGDLLYSKGNYYIHKRGEPVVVYSSIALETVGEWTGLTDKNGVKIFEGDILIDDNNWFKGLVVFRHIGISPDCDDSCEGSGFYAVVQRIPYRGLTYICSSKIIGNIHDNPELWEEEE